MRFAFFTFANGPACSFAVDQEPFARKPQPPPGSSSGSALVPMAVGSAAGAGAGCSSTFLATARIPGAYLATISVSTCFSSGSFQLSSLRRRRIARTLKSVVI